MRFLVDLMCGGIVSALRMCGHDTVYAGDRDLEADADLLRVARAEDRMILTRDVELASRAPRVQLLESHDVEDQLETLAATGISLELTPEPRRCGQCNGVLDRLDRTASTPASAPDPDELPVWHCRDCTQHFWKGSHWDHVGERLGRVRSRANVDASERSERSERNRSQSTDPDQ